ncbi:ladderlectin-like [Pimephales promelas]|uniref:ladderlectin-like n=1 Tax=Pimephales promelas TaxID=90988 RepID=UPI001955AD00|nr:ladderlectin-like [Pimephales promelas]
MAMLRSVILLFFIFSMGNADVNLVERCPYGWTNFGLQCYKYFSQSVTWITAEKNCQALGANLVSVHSKAENDFVLSLVPSSSTRFWAGAHDGEQEGQWLWSDGSVSGDFGNWCSAEPNNAGGSENCLELSYSSNRCWNDASCSTPLSYVCIIDV